MYLNAFNLTSMILNALSKEFSGLKHDFLGLKSKVMRAKLSELLTIRTVPRLTWLKHLAEMITH